MTTTLEIHQLSSGQRSVSDSINVLGTATTIKSELIQLYIIGRITNLGLIVDSSGQPNPALIHDESLYCKLNGHFTLVIGDLQRGTLRIVACRAGGNRVYFRKINGNFKISTTPEALLDSSIGNQWSQPALREMLEFRWHTNEQSLISDISILQTGQYLEFDTINSPTPRLISYWRFPASSPTECSLEQERDTTRELLRRSLSQSLRTDKPVAVLLSGGVDSSILAALVKELGIEFSAISFRNVDHATPELETAKEFAALLGVEHRIIDLADSEVEDLFCRSTCIIGQPLRAQSGLVLTKIFSQLQGEFSQVVYGEAADSLFGSKMVQRYQKRYSKRRMLSLPGVANLMRLAGRGASVDDVTGLTPVSHHIREQGFNYSKDVTAWLDNQFGNTDFLQLTKLLLAKPEESLSQLKLDLALIKAMNLRGEIANQFHSTCSLARHYDLELVSPFADFEVMLEAAMLSDELYFGNDFVKPVLRAIGENYFPRELMYLPKSGFPVPFRYWTKNCLGDLWHKACGYFALDPDQFDDAEFRWTACGLYVLAKTWNLPSFPEASGLSVQ